MRTLIRMGGHFVMTRLVQTEAFDGENCAQAPSKYVYSVIDRSPSSTLPVSPPCLSPRVPRRIAQRIDRCLGVPQPRLALESPSPVVLPEVHREMLVKYTQQGCTWTSRPGLRSHELCKLGVSLIDLFPMLNVHGFATREPRLGLTL